MRHTTRVQEPSTTLDGFVVGPSRITKKLVEIVSRLNTRYEGLLAGRNIIMRFIMHFRMSLYLKEGHMEFYRFLKGYKVPDFDAPGIQKLGLLLGEFERLYDKTLFNNLALAYAYTLRKELSSPIFTMEDQKMLFLKRLHDKEITVNQFNAAFGHYALNAYELSSERFEEYDSARLLSLARLASKVEIPEKLTLEVYMDSGAKDRIPILIALREMAKYHVLFIIREMRRTLLGLAEENGIEDIFDRSYDDILSLAEELL